MGLVVVDVDIGVDVVVFVVIGGDDRRSRCVGALGGLIEWLFVW